MGDFGGVWFAIQLNGGRVGMVVFVEKLLIFNWELCPFYVIINNFNELLQIRRSQTCMHCFKNGSLLIHLKKNLLAKLVYTCANTKKNVQPINACSTPCYLFFSKKQDLFLTLLVLPMVYRII